MTGAVAHPDRIVLVHALTEETKKLVQVLSCEVPASADGLVRHRASGWTMEEKAQLQDLQLDLHTLLQRQLADPATAFERADMLAFLDIAAATCRLAAQALTRGIGRATGRVYRELYEGELGRVGLMLAAIDEERARVADGSA